MSNKQRISDVLADRIDNACDGGKFSKTRIDSHSQDTWGDALRQER